MINGMKNTGRKDFIEDCRWLKKNRCRSVDQQRL